MSCTAASSSAIGRSVQRASASAASTNTASASSPPPVRVSHSCPVWARSRFVGEIVITAPSVSPPLPIGAATTIGASAHGQTVREASGWSPANALSRCRRASVVVRVRPSRDAASVCFSRSTTSAAIPYSCS
jgi:hypothetical protein